MRKITMICLLAIASTGCNLMQPKKEPIVVSIGLSEADFKAAHKDAFLVYLSDDGTSSYQQYRGNDGYSTTSDFYYFKNEKLSKFEKKTHYFDRQTIKVESPKDSKN